MRSSGSPSTLDLSANGALSVNVTPGAAIVPVQFTLATPKFDIRGNPPVVPFIAFHVVTTFNQAAAGGAVVNPDALPQIVDSFNVSNPLMGTTHEQSCYTGPIVKHVIEFIALGYRHFGGNRVQIPAADGNTQVDLFFALPFTMECFDRPLDFCPWVGWLVNMQATINFAAQTAIGTPAQGGSTGAVTDNTLVQTSIKAWVELEPRRQLAVNAVAQWRLYNPTAAGSTQALLQNVGQQGGLNYVLPGSRLAVLVELMNKLGLGGASTLDNYTSVTIPALQQDITFNVDSFILRARALAGPNRDAFSLGSGIANVHPNAGWPYTLASTPNLALDTNALMNPYRVPGDKSRIAKQPKVQGNITAIRSFTTPVVSGTFPFITCELRQASPQGAAALLQAAGVSSDRVAAISIDADDAPIPTPGSRFGLPRQVPNAA